MSRLGKGLVVVICTLVTELAVFGLVFYRSVVLTNSGSLGAFSFGPTEFVILTLLPALVAGGVSMGLNKPRP